MSIRPVRKAVFPVAGLGTRLLPATKSMPKEMLTIVDRPLIQYAVDEAREAGIEQMIFVTGRGKGALEDYFDIGFELEATMRERGKSLDPLARRAHRFRRDRLGPPAAAARPRPCRMVRAAYRRRRAVRGAAARRSDGRQPGALKQMVDAYDRARRQYRLRRGSRRPTGPRATASSRPARPTGSRTEVLGLVEKPAPADAPSTLGVIGRYILQPEVMGVLDAQETGAGGEIQLTDAHGQADRQAAVPRGDGRRGAPRLRRQGGLRARQSARSDCSDPDDRPKLSASGRLTAPVRRPSRDNRASSGGGSWAGSSCRGPAIASWSGGSARGGSASWPGAGCGRPSCRLHGAQAVATFSQVVRPPWARGTTWSKVNSLRLPQ